MEATLTWLALMARKDKGCKAVRREVAAAGDPFEVWRQWEERHLAEAREAMALAGQQMEVAMEAGAEVVTCQDVRYPQMLANIPDAPPVVYSRGRWPLEWGRALSVVGTHTCPRAVGRCGRSCIQTARRRGGSFIGPCALPKRN